jgi:hypothetical protein
MKSNLHEYHRFLDEAGDTTFYGKGRIPIIGTNGVSNVFIIGMVKYNEPLEPLRRRIIEFSSGIESNPYYRKVASVLKRTRKGNFYFHAKDDLPELRKEFYDFILSIDCTFQAVVGRKDISLFEKKHNGKDTEFYADLLSHLIKDKFAEYSRLVFNVAERSNSTAINNLEVGLDKARNRFQSKFPNKEISAIISFNVHKFKNEPLLSVTDYFCWSIQRIFEMGETRFYEYIFDKISLVIDLYDSQKFNENMNYYKKGNPLTEKNKVSPQSS